MRRRVTRSADRHGAGDLALIDPLTVQPKRCINQELLEGRHPAHWQLLMSMVTFQIVEGSLYRYPAARRAFCVRSRRLIRCLWRRGFVVVIADAGLDPGGAGRHVMKRRSWRRGTPSGDISIEGNCSRYYGAARHCARLSMSRFTLNRQNSRSPVEIAAAAADGFAETPGCLHDSRGLRCAGNVSAMQSSGVRNSDYRRGEQIERASTAARHRDARVTTARRSEQTHGRPWSGQPRGLASPAQVWLARRMSG